MNFDVKRWEKEIKETRKQKNDFFKLSYQSPIPQGEREYFKGLSYYPSDTKYRFESELFEHSQKNVLEIEDTKGNIRKFMRWGEFRFDIDNVVCKLQVYKSDAGGDILFLPFKDLTSGKDTYPAGRYLDLEPARDMTPEGKWILDFNKAYNPWCAYSKDYACPFTPPENWLKVSIKAGEKSYS